jgi:signal transduction histidine kinase
MTPLYYFSSVEREDEVTPRLLVVEDDLINQELFKRVFESEYAVTPVMNGETALHLLQEQTFDLVLLDLMLPGLNGYEVLQNLRGQYDSSELPVVIVSALRDENDILRGLKLGANDYISKPYSIEIARARVKTQIQLKRLNDKRKRMIEDLQTAQRLQESFYRIVTHDLKGPITNMRLAQTILRDLLRGDEHANSILDNVDMTLEDMQEMIRMFLDISALQTGALQTNIQCVSTSDAIRGVIERLALVATKKRINVHADMIDGLLMADPRLLGQVLTNLLSNALKFSPFETTISIWTELDPDSVTIYVADQGPGVPPSEQPKLFEIFRTLSARPTDGESSHGLGLWIVRQLVELQGGRVGYSAPLDGGSIFYVKFPRCDV